MPTPSKNQSHEGEIQSIIDNAIQQWIAQGRSDEAKFAINNFFTGRGKRMVDDIMALLQNDYEAKVVEKIEKLKIKLDDDNIIPCENYYDYCEKKGYNQALSDLQTELKEKK